MAKQRKLDQDLQQAVIDCAAIQYPQVTGIEIPLLIALPCGIHPYNRANGYIDIQANAIVLYQDLGREAIHEGETERVISTIHHELAHWYQFNVLGERHTTKTNTHRRPSWQQACYVATCNLWPELGLERKQFTTYTSKRMPDIKSPVKVQREGSLTDTELHRWPRSLFKPNGTGRTVQ